MQTIVLITIHHLEMRTFQWASNHASYHVTPREFIVNWLTIAAPIVNQNLRCEGSLKVHKINRKLNNNKYVYDNILYGMLRGTSGLFQGFETLGLHVPLIRLF